MSVPSATDKMSIHTPHSHPSPFFAWQERNQLYAVQVEAYISSVLFPDENEDPDDQVCVASKPCRTPLATVLSRTSLLTLLQRL